MTPKVSALINAKKSEPEPTPLAPIAWVPLDPQTDRGEHGLTPLLVHRLGHRLKETKLTFAQMLAQRLIDDALRGHFRSMEEILTRIDGDAKTSAPAASYDVIPLGLDELTAQSVLYAYPGSKDGPP